MLDEMQGSVGVGPRVEATMEEPDPRQQLRMWPCWIGNVAESEVLGSAWSPERRGPSPTEA